LQVQKDSDREVGLMSETKPISRRKIEVDWSDPLLSRWMDTIVREGTKAVYRSAYRLYAEFTGLDAKQLISEALDDMKKGPLERRDIVKTRLLKFYSYLTTETGARRSGPKGGLSEKIANTYVNSVRSFYATFDIVVKFKGRSRLPKPRIRNPRLILTPNEVKGMLDHTATARDRAIILTMFQGGMDVSTLCSMKYGAVRAGLEKGELPLLVKLYRQKSGTQYFTFLGRDSIEAIKTYLNYLQSRSISLKDNSPLFVKFLFKEKVEGIEPVHVMKMLREVALMSGLISKEQMSKSHYNTAGSHALRESFSSILANKNISSHIVDFMLGHEVGELKAVYQQLNPEQLRQIYKDVEPFLSITSSTQSQIDKELQVLNSRIDQQQQTIGELHRMTRTLLEALATGDHKALWKDILQWTSSNK